MVSVPPSLTSTGKRKRRYFPNETQAKKFAAKVRSMYRSGERSLIDVSLATEAKQAAAILEGTGISIIEAARMAKEKVGSSKDQESFIERYRRACDAMEGHWSRRYLTDMEKLPRWFPKNFQNRPCGSIGRESIVEALQHRGELAQSTIDLRSRMVSAILNYRKKHRKSSSIHILDRKQQKASLDACETQAERWAVAVLLYAGIRPDAEYGEVTRLDWSDFSRQAIHIRESVSKTGSDRIIPIAPVPTPSNPDPQDAFRRPLKKRFPSNNKRSNASAGISSAARPRNTATTARQWAASPTGSTACVKMPCSLPARTHATSSAVSVRWADAGSQLSADPKSILRVPCSKGAFRRFCCWSTPS